MMNSYEVEGSVSDRCHCMDCKIPIKQGQPKLIIKRGYSYMSKVAWISYVCAKCGAKRLDGEIKELENTKTKILGPGPFDPPTWKNIRKHLNLKKI